jgi:hypothetical protein
MELDRTKAAAVEAEVVDAECNALCRNLDLAVVVVAEYARDQACSTRMGHP